MRYRILGRSGLRVSEISLGTLTWRNDANAVATCQRIFDRYIEAGGNFVDTANMYGKGQSEEVVGRLIKEHRQKIVLATKFGHSMDTDDPNAAGSHRKNLRSALEASLRRLQTDYVDLLWVHSFDHLTPVEETMRALDDVVRAGQVHALGLSNTPVWRAAEAVMTCRQHNLAPISALQLQYSLVARDIEFDFVPFAKAFGLAILAWAPLAGGLLSGKYLAPIKDGQPSRGRLDAVPAAGKSLNARNLSIAQTLHDVAARGGYADAAVALRWLLEKGAMPIVGATSLEQFDQSLAALACELNGDDLRKLSEVSAIDAPYPHSLWPRINEMQFGKAHEKVVI